MLLAATAVGVAVRYRHAARIEWAERVRALEREQLAREIGHELHSKASTVKFHIASLLARLQVRNRVEPAIWDDETDRARPGR